MCSQYRLSKFQEEKDRRDEVDHSTGEHHEVPAVDEDADATPITGCQREASDQASIPGNLESGSESSKFNQCASDCG